MLNERFSVFGLTFDVVDHHLSIYCFLCFVGIGETDQMSIYQILAAILHLSNVEVKDQSADRCSISVNIDKEIFNFASLFNL